MDHAMMGETEEFRRERGLTDNAFARRRDQDTVPAERPASQQTASDLYAHSAGWLA